MRTVIVTMLLSVSLSACSGMRPVFHESAKLGDGKEWRMYPVIADLNNDQKQDIVAAHRRPLTENSLHLFLGAGDGTFQELPQTWSSPGYSGLAVGDLNEDRQLDIIAGSHFNRLHTYVQNGEVGKYSEAVLATGDGYIEASIVDLYGVGQPQVVMLGNERAGIEIFDYADPVGLILKSRLLEGNIGRQIRIVDMNRDGKLDLVTSFARIGVVILLQNEHGGWDEAPKTNFRSETNEFRSMDVADVNGDGWPDVILNGGYAGVGNLNGPDVYLSSGKDLRWTEVTKGFKIYRRPAEGVVAADFNGDGATDIVAGGNMTGGVNNKAYGLFLFLGNGKGAWSLDASSGLPDRGLPRPYGLVAKDLNGDGLPDLTAIHGAPEEGDGFVSVWLAKRQIKAVAGAE